MSAPVCHGHEHACLRLTAGSGRDEGRHYFICACEPHRRCSTFIWAGEVPPVPRQCIPTYTGHNLACRLYQSKKPGPSFNCWFYRCSQRGERQCRFFEWVAPDDPPAEERGPARLPPAASLATTRQAPPPPTPTRGPRPAVHSSACCSRYDSVRAVLRFDEYEDHNEPGFVARVEQGEQAAAAKRQRLAAGGDQALPPRPAARTPAAAPARAAAAAVPAPALMAAPARAATAAAPAPARLAASSQPESYYGPVAVPPGWWPAVDPATGSTFYTHPATGTRQWFHPGLWRDEAAAEAARLAYYASLPLPPGWELAVDPDSGYTYYYHDAADVRQWYHPGQRPRLG